MKRTCVRSARSALLGALSVISVACGGGSPGEGELLELAAQRPPSADGERVDGIAVAVSGGGCVGGAWHGESDPEGASISATFAEFEARVGEKAPAASSDCRLNISLPATAARAYAVKTVYFQGYGEVDEGLSGRALVQVDGAGGFRQEIELAGPRHDYFGFYRELPHEELAWQPCGAALELDAKLELALEGGSADKSGFLSLTTQGWERLYLEVASRPCDD